MSSPIRPFRLSLLGLAMVSFTAVGCANGPGSDAYRVPRSTRLASTTLGSDPADTGYRCPAKANVVPDYDWDFDGSAHYRVCTSLTSSYELLIHGQTHDNDMICVFPVQYVDATHIYVKPDLATGAPLYQCMQATDAGIRMKFDLINFNAVFIVEAQHREAMQGCLTTQDYYSCPRYSFGKFR